MPPPRSPGRAARRVSRVFEQGLLLRALGDVVHVVAALALLERLGLDLAAPQGRKRSARVRKHQNGNKHAWDDVQEGGLAHLADDEHHVAQHEADDVADHGDREETDDGVPPVGAVGHARVTEHPVVVGFVVESQEVRDVEPGDGDVAEAEERVSRGRVHEPWHLKQHGHSFSRVSAGGDLDHYRLREEHGRDEDPEDVVQERQHEQDAGDLDVGQLHSPLQGEQERNAEDVLQDPRVGRLAVDAPHHGEADADHGDEGVHPRDLSHLREVVGGAAARRG
mmetsp:Transcript_1657/g.3197  ORF Transcript_1657/g.3197 Transcript_1657/m.3197 type:complete len:280 (-) Transcript_1657:845-1684(-)